jgi:hypothetical protein
VNGRIRIIGALLIGGAIIGCAFVYGKTPVSEQSGSVTAAEETFRTYIPTKDSDGDGARDWEESFKAARSETSGVIETTTSEVTYEAPDTLTEEFAQSFFEEYTRRTLAGEMLNNDADAFIDSSLTSLEHGARDTLFTHSDLTFGTDDFASIRKYGNTIAEIVLAHPLEITGPIAILEESLETNDREVLTKLGSVSNTYSDILDHMLETPVPPTLRKEHLDLVNTYRALHADINAMYTAYEDPMYAIVRIKRYQEDSYALVQAYENIYSAAHAQEITYSIDEPAYILTEILKTITL